MFTVQDQIAHEKHYADLSAQSYFHKQDKLRDSKRGDEIDSARSIMRRNIEEVAISIENITKVTAGVGGKYNKLLTEVATFDDEPDFNVLAYMGIQAIFRAFGKAHNNTDWVTIAMSIANTLEFEHKTRKFEDENPGYYHVMMTSLEEQQVSSYDHLHKVLSKKMTDFNMQWDNWNSNTKIQLANKVLIAIMHNMDGIFFRSSRYSNGKTIATIDTTVEADEWLATFEAERGFLNPVRVPTLIEPISWEKNIAGEIHGGYYSYRLSTILVKAHGEKHLAYIADFEMEQHLSAINKMQKTAWCVNQRVLDVQHTMFSDEDNEYSVIPSATPIDPEDIPGSIAGVAKSDMTDAQLDTLDAYKSSVKAMHRADKARKGRVIQYKMTHDVALKYADKDKFYYVYTPDFRGRIYSDVTGLSPQGTDAAKSLLQFANGKEVTASGLFWLAVHGANTYGKDKVSYDDRVDWIYDKKQTDKFKRIVDDPIGNISDWQDADKPWQFLAFVYAWTDTDYGKDTTAVVNLPIGLDGSCNGLQHYSALLRDKVGGAGVNLTDSPVPADVYADVSRRLEVNLRSMGADINAQLWLRTGLGRKLTKRPVMTLPYGSTQTSARAYIYEWALDNQHKFRGMSPKEIYTACIWLTPHLWKAISEIVIAARAAMDWIQSRVVSEVNKSGAAITWTSPVAFPVYQPYTVQDNIRVETRISGGIQCRMRVNVQEDTDTVSKTKQRSGIAPNFVHSLDSSHMVMVINGTDFQDYAMIHDDFGTHAADTEVMWKVIRSTFVDMYKDKDPLLAWSNQQGYYDGEYPEKGTLDINSVLDSSYFFG